MAINISRNSGVRIASLTSAASAALGVGVWASAGLRPVRAASSSGFLLDSTQTNLDIPYDVDDKMGYIASWACTAMTTAVLKACVLRINAGDEWQSGLGAADIMFSDTSSGVNSTAGLLRKYMIGPLESARFVRSAASSNARATVGDPAVNFALTTARMTGALGTRECFKVHIQPFKMPVVNYST